MKYLIMFLLCLTSLVSEAGVYQQTDDDGDVVYSDTPLDSNAKIITPAATNEVQAQQSTSAAVGLENNTKKTHLSYNTFAINSPKDQDTIQNQPTIPVEINMDPDLQEGDKIQLLLDGKPQGDAKSNTHLALSQVERGTHQLAAEIIDSNGSIVKQSNTITIYVHQANTLQIRANGANGKPVNQ